MLRMYYAFLLHSLRVDHDFYSEIIHAQADQLMIYLLL